MAVNNKRNLETYTRDYLESEFEPTMVQYRRQKVLEIMNQYSPKKILEIGCGMHSICNFYHDYEAFTVVEPSTVFCDEVKRSEFFDEKITVIQALFENVISVLQEKQFDFVIVSSLLHEVPDPNMFLQSLYKICTKDTIIHINVPNSESFHLLWAYESGLIKKLNQLTETARKFQQNTVFNLKSLSKMCHDAGFNILEDEGGNGSYFIKIFNHKKMADCINQGIIDSQLLDGLNRLTKYFPNHGSEIYVNCKIGVVLPPPPCRVLFFCFYYKAEMPAFYILLGRGGIKCFL